MKRATPLKTRRRAKRTAEEREQMLAWASDLGPCVVCPAEGGTCSGPVQGHHAVPRQTLRRWGLPLWDIRNRVAVCEWRHEQHTTAYRRIPLRVLSAETWAFAAEYGFVDYLHKTYEDAA